jgi:iron complex outermembrane receptor protein
LSYAYLIGRIDELGAPAHTIFDPAVNRFSPYQVGDDVRGLFDPSQGYAPRHSIDANLDYEVVRLAQGVVSTHLNYRWQAKRPGAGPDVPGSQYAQAPAYGLLNASIALGRGVANGHRTTVTLWGRNILDKRVPVWVNGFGSIIPISAAPAGYTGSIYEGWLEPRRYGASLAYQF